MGFFLKTSVTLVLGMIPRYYLEIGKRYPTARLKTVDEGKSIYFLLYLMKLRPFS